MNRRQYEAPKITDEQELEVHAMACGKVPGIGDENYCGPVWALPAGQSEEGCYMNPDSRSS